MKRTLALIAFAGIVGGAVAMLAMAQPDSSPPTRTHIDGYTFGTDAAAKSPLTITDLNSLKRALLFTDDDVKYLRMSKPILEDQTEAILDVWYGFVASTPELVHFFGNKDTGKPESEYLSRVRARFGRWIIDTAEANYDQKWLDYQHEIALRHHSTKKNKTDNATSAPIVNYRYVPALTIPVTTTLKPFLSKKGASPEDVEKMHAAWVKAVLLQSILWGQPYVRDGEF